tara:strand:+ start:7220 stop:7582 length:363 start_codon:yes stop_codon:yes gene_type:complete
VYAVNYKKRMVKKFQLLLEIGVVIVSSKKDKQGLDKEEDDIKKCSCGCGEILKPRDTPYWKIEGDIEEKKEVFSEGCREDDKRVTNAERGLHSRLTESEREKALKWASLYRWLVRDGVDD